MRRHLILASVLSAAGAALGVAIGGPLTSNGTQPPIAYELLPSGNCRGCHGFDYDPANYIEPGDTWTGSMKSQAARDPLFWAALDVANHDVPNSGDFCLRCHAPAGWLAGRSEPPAGSTDGCALEGTIDEYPGTDFGGVTCHVCHRMKVNDAPPPGQQSMYLENAQFWIDDSDCAGRGEPCRYGPYDYLSPYEAPAPHAWSFAPYFESSDSCGNCHNVTNPARNLIVNGVDTGIRVPLERTHREWQASAYGRTGPAFESCQGCHMPDAVADPVYACAFSENNRSGDLGIHEFAGGNSWIPEVLRQEYPTLGLATELAATRDAALRMLQQRAARVSIVVPPQATPGGLLNVQVNVTNLTGHKLPTGYPEGRRMWLHVVARDGQGAPFWESGAYDTATGVLSHDSALKVYEAKVGIWNLNRTGACDTTDGTGASIFHFVRNDCVVMDNRIPPKRFTGGADPEIRPVGYVYPETAPGSGILVNYDVTSYAVPVPAQAVSPITVTATLQYQTTSKEHVDFLRDEAVTNKFPKDCIQRTTGPAGKSRGGLLYDMWTSYGRSAPVAMATVKGTAAIPATPGEASGATPMRVTSYDRPSGNVTLAYAPACAAVDHTVYIGRLADVATMAFLDQACALGASGTASVHLGSESYFWLIVGNDATHEGSYGTGANGLERPEDTALPACNLPQDLSRRCIP